MSPIPEYGTTTGYVPHEAQVREGILGEPLGERAVVLERDMCVTYRGAEWAEGVVSRDSRVPQGVKWVGGVEIPTVVGDKNVVINWVELIGLAFSQDMGQVNWLASVKRDAGVADKVLNPISIPGYSGNLQAADMVVDGKRIPVVTSSYTSLKTAFVPEEVFWKEVVKFGSGVITFVNHEGIVWNYMVEAATDRIVASECREIMVAYDNAEVGLSVDQGIPGYVIRYKLKKDRVIGGQLPGEFKGRT